jgi:hypothetical protein
LHIPRLVVIFFDRNVPGAGAKKPKQQKPYDYQRRNQNDPEDSELGGVIATRLQDGRCWRLSRQQHPLLLFELSLGQSSRIPKLGKALQPPDHGVGYWIIHSGPWLSASKILIVSAVTQVCEHEPVRLPQLDDAIIYRPHSAERLRHRVAPQAPSKALISALLSHVARAVAMKPHRYSS